MIDHHSALITTMVLAAAAATDRLVAAGIARGARARHLTA
jgi:hypothetical protein